MTIFSRTRDIIAANVTDLLDRAENPAKTIRMIIVEMEETLVEVRSSAARTIADRKEIRRHVERLAQLQADWTDKAALALSKDREDLARAALVEKQKAADMAAQLEEEAAALDESLRSAEGDIAKLQKKLQDARSRQNVLLSRLEGAENRARLREMYAGEKVAGALSRFGELERQVDEAEARADATLIGREVASLEDEFAALQVGDRVDDELAAMKAALGRENG